MALVKYLVDFGSVKMPSDAFAEKPLVLVVEDSEDTREAMAEILQIEGFAVSTAENGQQALEVLRGENPCVVLLDLMMPIMSGWEFLRYRKERQELAKIPVIVISAMMDEAAGARAEGADEFLRKPMDIPTLVNVVKRLSAEA